MYEGLDNEVFKTYVFGGFVLIAVSVFIATLIIDIARISGPAVYFMIFGPVFIWFVGIILFWWWVILFKDKQELKELVQVTDKGIPGIQSLKNWNSLHQAMVISGGNVEEFSKQEKKANRPGIVWFGLMNLLPIWIFGYVVLGALNIININDTRPLVFGVFACVAILIVGTYFLFGWGRKIGKHAYLKPLGLSITSVPVLKSDVIAMMGGGQRLIPDGPVIVEGQRYGRLVHIETIDKHSLTIVQTELSEFKVQSKEGKLTPGKNAPEEVVGTLKSLRKAKRWLGIEVYCGLYGIAIQRESRGTNMWLYDLWLAEYLLDKLS
jgi:hypothetical protein